MPDVLVLGVEQINGGGDDHRVGFQARLALLIQTRRSFQVADGRDRASENQRNADAGDDDARSILARQLSERADLVPFPTVIANWFRTAFAAKPEDRFADGLEMKKAWGKATEKVLARQRGPWWRRVVS